ncbi:MAG: LPS assembly lipoprotein LptE [Alphaproteobacteria bacterium]|nr:LPS assembly lipoprotein LptE [Alphaproteobacteria bacterium]
MLKLTRIALASFFFLSACGFSPIYGTHGGNSESVAKALGAVTIENIPDRNGQLLRNKLIDRMYSQGRPQTPTAKLSVAITSAEYAMGVQKDATTTRSQLSMTANFALTNMDGKEIHRGKAHAVASYSKLDAQYGTLASQRNAYERALNEIGEQIVNNLSLYYAEKAPHKINNASAKE